MCVCVCVCVFDGTVCLLHLRHGFQYNAVESTAGCAKAFPFASITLRVFIPFISCWQKKNIYIKKSFHRFHSSWLEVFLRKCWLCGMKGWGKTTTHNWKQSGKCVCVVIFLGQNTAKGHGKQNGKCVFLWQNTTTKGHGQQSGKCFLFVCF